MNKNPIAEALSSVTLAPAVVVDNLTMIPLVASEAKTSPLDYVVLDDALASGDIEITEVSDQGSVPELRVINRGGKPVLIIDGEELVGAKQNRVVNLTILVPAHAELTIPVSCVEAGRWRSRSRSFTAAPRTQYASGRARRMAQVSMAMSERQERVSDQVEVWNDIAAMSVRLNATSATSAMEAIYRRHETSLDSSVTGLAPVERQVGAMFAIGNRVVGLDLFDRASTLATLLPKLVRSVAVDAIDTAGLPQAVVGREALVTQASDFLATTASSNAEMSSAVGVGEDIRLSGPISGAALSVGDSVVHLGAFNL